MRRNPRRGGKYTLAAAQSVTGWKQLHHRAVGPVINTPIIVGSNVFLPREKSLLPSHASIQRRKKKRDGSLKIPLENNCRKLKEPIAEGIEVTIDIDVVEKLYVYT